MRVARPGVLAWNATPSQPGRHHLGDGIGIGGLAILPVKTIVEGETGASAQFTRGSPISDDMVLDLVLGGNLHQLDRARAPIALGFHPDAGALVVEGAVVLIVGEIAVALDQ